MKQPLSQKWREQAKEYETDGQPGAAILRRVAKELENWIKEYLLEELNLDQAAKESGYTKDNLFRLIHDGKLKNYGEPRSPRVRREDLPRKPGYRPHPDPDPVGDAARSFTSSRETA